MRVLYLLVGFRFEVDQAKAHVGGDSGEVGSFMAEGQVQDRGIVEGVFPDLLHGLSITHVSIAVCVSRSNFLSVLRDSHASHSLGVLGESANFGEVIALQDVDDTLLVSDPQLLGMV